MDTQSLFDNSPDALTRLEAAAKRVEESRIAMEQAQQLCRVLDAIVIARAEWRRQSKGERAGGGGE